MIGLENKNLEEDRNLILNIARKTMERCKIDGPYPYSHVKKHEKDFSTLNGDGICKFLDYELGIYYSRLVKLWNGEYKTNKLRERLLHELSTCLRNLEKND